MSRYEYYNKLSYIVSFFHFIGYYAGLEVIIFLGLINESSYYSIPLRIIIIFLMLLYLVKTKIQYSIRTRNILLFFWTFWILYFSSIFRELLNPSAFLIFSPFEYLSYSIVYSIIPFLFFASNKNNQQLNSILNALLFSGLVLSVLTISLYGKYLFMGIGRISNIIYSSDATAVISPLALSYCSSIVITISLNYLLFTKLSGKRKLYFLTIIALGIAPFLLGSSRGSALTMGISLITIIYFKRGIASKVKYFVLVIIISALVVFIANSLDISMFERIAASLDAFGSGSSDAKRIEQWNSAWSQFLNSPFFGDSIQNNVPPYTHNIILGILMAVGAIGLLPFLVILIFALKKVKFIAKYIPEHNWIVVLFIHGLLMGMVSGAIYSSIFLWAGTGLLFSVKHSVNYYNTKGLTKL